MKHFIKNGQCLICKLRAARQELYMIRKLERGHAIFGGGGLSEKGQKKVKRLEARISVLRLLIKTMKTSAESAPV
jgi:hypothetical protein